MPRLLAPAISILKQAVAITFVAACLVGLFPPDAHAAASSGLMASPAETSKRAIAIHKERRRNSVNTAEDFEYVIGLGDVLDISIYGEGSMRAEQAGSGGNGANQAGNYGYTGGYTGGGYNGYNGGGYGGGGYGYGGGGGGDQGNRGDVLRGGGGSMRVRLDGRITLLHLGDVKVAGMTISQLRDYLKKLYSPIFEDPLVTVVLKETNSRRYFVMGQVEEPGTFYLDFPITLIQAIARSNGFKDCGCGEVWAGNNITIIRRENGREKLLKFNYSSFINGQNLQQNVLIVPGDTIIVP